MVDLLNPIITPFKDYGGRLNPMKCAKDIQIYNSNIHEDRVYVFLDGLDDSLDKIRSDVLQIKPFPTVEQAYAHVRREDTR